VRFVRIVYGYPAPETFGAADRGEVLLGGCLVFDEMPEARCPACLTDLRWTGELWTPVAQRSER
jgi:hypothetical protein